MTSLTYKIAVTMVLVSTLCAAARRRQPVAPTAWTVQQPTGLRTPAPVDTLFEDYAKRSVPSMTTDAYTTTGNLGAEGDNRIYMDRAPGYGPFFFDRALKAWMPSVSNTLFFNSGVPLTHVSFNSAGGRDNAQERLRAVFSGNVNKATAVGAMLDYLYSKGCYEAQASKDMMWGVSASHLGQRFDVQAFYNHWNMLNKENGGIVDSRYITDPAAMQGGVSSVSPKAIPVRLTAAHTRVVGGELLLNGRYKLGYWHREKVDTTEVRTFVPVTAIMWNLNFKDGRHIFTDNAPGELKNFFDNTYLDATKTYDKTTYSMLTNTVGIQLLEGFHRWAKFGLTGYLTHSLRRYAQTPDTLDRTSLTPLPPAVEGLAPKATENLVWAGGELTKQRGSILTYGARAQFGLLGPAAGDVELGGSLRTRFRLFGDTVSIQAGGAFTNTHAPYLLNNYLSNHFAWRNNFGKERRTRIDGRLDIPHTGTAVEACVENVQNLIYFGANWLPAQYDGNVQVASVRLHQKLNWRALHWDNRITWQRSGNEDIVPLPQLAVYSNLYLLFNIATLKVQLGMDCDWYTRFYAPLYQPATMTFGNQRQTKLGNYPFMNLYANMRLSKVRFYVMMSHVNQGIIGGNNYFSMPNYPLNPRRFQLGLSVDFTN